LQKNYASKQVLKTPDKQQAPKPFPERGLRIKQQQLINDTGDQQVE